MKNSNLTAITLAGLGLVSSSSVSGEDTSLPTGEISSAVSQIQEGQTPQLNWRISYPPDLKKYFDPVTVTTKLPAVAKVKVLGQGVTSGDTLVRTAGTMSIGSSPFVTVFDGVNTNVSSSPLGLEGYFGSSFEGDVIPADTKIRFGGKYYKGRDKWSQHYFTGDGTTNVRVLVDGDTPPSGLGVSGGPTLESFLRPYLDSAGKVNVGPMDVIVFMELTHTSAQSTSSGYDFQDMLFLVTFSKPITTSNTTIVPR